MPVSCRLRGQHPKPRVRVLPGLIISPSLQKYANSRIAGARGFVKPNSYEAQGHPGPRRAIGREFTAKWQGRWRGGGDVPMPRPVGVAAYFGLVQGRHLPGAGSVPMSAPRVQYAIVAGRQKWSILLSVPALMACLASFDGRWTHRQHKTTHVSIMVSPASDRHTVSREGPTYNMLGHTYKMLDGDLLCCPSGRRFVTSPAERKQYGLAWSCSSTRMDKRNRAASVVKRSPEMTMVADARLCHFTSKTPARDGQAENPQQDSRRQGNEDVGVELHVVNRYFGGALQHPISAIITCP